MFGSLTSPRRASAIPVLQTWVGGCRNRKIRRKRAAACFGRWEDFLLKASDNGKINLRSFLTPSSRTSEVGIKDSGFMVSDLERTSWFKKKKEGKRREADDPPVSLEEKKNDNKGKESDARSGHVLLTRPPEDIHP